MKPPAHAIHDAVFFAVAQVSGRDINRLNDDMILGGTFPDGAGMDQEACDAVAGLLNIFIAHNGGKKRIARGELTPNMKIDDVNQTVAAKF